MRIDTDLRRDVFDELEWEPSIDAAEIGVASHNGIVTLTGDVKSYAEKLTAERVTKRIHGVKAIANDINVRLPGVAERTDSDIAGVAVDALNWITSIPEGRIKVAVSKGWLTLDGEVDWRYQKDAAFNAVHHLVGVKGVTNLITLKSRPSATEVKSRIEAAFRRSAELDAKSVRVETHNGR
jgi:osmotically-inducible protein OsmY